MLNPHIFTHKRSLNTALSIPIDNSPIATRADLLLKLEYSNTGIQLIKTADTAAKESETSKDTGTQESWGKFFSEYNSPKPSIPVLLKSSNMKAWQMFIVSREPISQSLRYSYIVEMYYSDKTNSNSLPHKDYEAFDASRGFLRLDVGTAESSTKRQDA